MTGPAPATTRNKGQRHRWRAVGVGAAATLLLAACGSTAPKPSASGTSPAKATSSVDLRGVTITLEGPNQWNDSGSSFGKPWTNLIASFKKATGITVKTVVLPLASFGSTETTQLAAGTAPQLVFDQATYKPYMITNLNPYLYRPNPFVKNNKKWLSVFRSEYYGPTNPQSLDANGNFFMIPFNLVAVGVYYNENAFAKAHVKAPIATFQDLLTACHQLKAAGYTPFAMNNSTIGVSWTEESIFNQLAAGEGLYEKLDDYAAKGAKGTNPVLVQEDFDRALALGTLNASRYPAEAETLKLMKELYDSCATPNWSGITGLSGSVVGLSQFAPGRAAMAWGVDFGFGALGGVHFKVS
ncbi:MAG: extracellular solute-binding protein, partial [Actinomycetota bacterium]|nr:extracellular solute-binding protein [Actinomycetota bacterium]